MIVTMPHAQELDSAIVGLRSIALDSGTTVAEMAAQLGESAAKVEDTLVALQSDGKVERLETSPERWRLTPNLRSTADLYMRVAGLIRSGEWTSYGALSLAVRGDEAGRQAVGRAAASFPTFPNPHRVLRKGGEIPKSWRDWSGNGPEACRALLAEEGVAFTEDGLASAECYVSAEELVARWDAGEIVTAPRARAKRAMRPGLRGGG